MVRMSMRIYCPYCDWGVERKVKSEATKLYDRHLQGHRMSSHKRIHIFRREAISRGEIHTSQNKIMLPPSRDKGCEGNLGILPTPMWKEKPKSTSLK